MCKAQNRECEELALGNLIYSSARKISLCLKCGSRPFRVLFHRLAFSDGSLRLMCVAYLRNYMQLRRFRRGRLLNSPDPYPREAFKVFKRSIQICQGVARLNCPNIAQAFHEKVFHENIRLFSLSWRDSNEMHGKGGLTNTIVEVEYEWRSWECSLACIQKRKFDVIFVLCVYLRWCFEFELGLFMKKHTAFTATVPTMRAGLGRVRRKLGTVFKSFMFPTRLGASLTVLQRPILAGYYACCRSFKGKIACEWVLCPKT